MKLKVIFFCTTCKYRNEMDLGLPKYVERQTVFETLNEALDHYDSTDKSHNLIPAIVEDKEDNV